VKTKPKKIFFHKIITIIPVLVVELRILPFLMLYMIIIEIAIRIAEMLFIKVCLLNLDLVRWEGLLPRNTI